MGAPFAPEANVVIHGRTPPSGAQGLGPGKWDGASRARDGAIEVEPGRPPGSHLRRRPQRDRNEASRG